MERSQPSPGLSPSLQIALITAVAATLGIVAGGALVYLQQRQNSGDDLLGSRRRSKASRSSSVNNAVPLFDSVQGWLKTQRSDGSSGASGLVNTQRSGRSGTLSGPPPTVPEVDESSFEDGRGRSSGRVRSGGKVAFDKKDLPLSDWEIHESEIEICKRPDGTLWHLGAGSFGQVFKAMRGGVQPVAVKVFPSNATDVQMADFQKEVVILKSCRDRNIVQFLGACITDTQTCLVTEYLENGDLFNALHRERKANITWYRRSNNPSDPLPAQPVPGLGKRIALDIARGLHFLHTHRIVHMDIKSPNVLLGRNNCAKLADVGLAKFLHKDYLSAAKSVGTFAWSAPEVLMGGRCTEKVDIFSLGVVLWELVTGESPARGRLRSVKVPQECSEAVKDLIDACMEADPEDRPSARDVVEFLSQQNERPVTGARRTRKQGTVGTTSGRVLDDIIRHAHVLGLHDYTRSDALVAAEYKDELKLYKRYVSELRAVFDGDKPPAPGTQQHERLRELIASFRQLLSIFLAEATDTSRELRGVDLRKAGQQEGSPAKEGAAANPQSSTIGKREEDIDWRPALQAMRLTPQQASAIVDARAQVTLKLEELTKERRAIIAALQSLTLAGDDGYSSAVDKTDELRRNMGQEGVVLHEYHYWFFAVALKPEQEAAVEIASFPFFPDPIAISDLMVKDAVNAVANAKHSAEVSSDHADSNNAAA